MASFFKHLRHSARKNNFIRNWEIDTCFHTYVGGSACARVHVGCLCVFFCTQIMFYFGELGLWPILGGRGVGGGGGADLSLQDRHPRRRSQIECDFDFSPHFTLSCQIGFCSDDISFTTLRKNVERFRNEAAAALHARQPPWHHHPGRSPVT